MTEQEWLECNDPQKMLEFLRGKVSDRRLRLFACACCRRIWHMLTDERSRTAVNMAEQYTEGQTTLEELKAAGRAAIEASWAWRDTQDAIWPDELTESAVQAAEAAEMTACSLSDGCVWGAHGGYGAWGAAIEAAAFGLTTEVREQEHIFQADLLRCLCGNLSRPVTVSPAVLAWNDGLVVRLAQAAYEERIMPEGTLDNSLLAILADALEEAGCTDEDILGHLRGPGPHVRGCWAVDLCLGKV